MVTKKRSGNQVKLDGTRANINLYQKSNSLDLPISRSSNTYQGYPIHPTR